MKSQSVIDWCRCGKSGIMHKNVEYLSCSEVEVGILSIIGCEAR